MTLEIMLLINAAALCLTSLALLALLFLHARRERSQERLREATIRLLDQTDRAADLLTKEDLSTVTDGLEQLRIDVAAQAHSLDRLLEKPHPAPLEDPVALEHQILSESWKRFRANGELSAALDDALQDRGWTQLLDQLANVVPADLKPTFDAIAGPCREQRSLLQRIELVPRIVNGNLARLATDAEEIRRTRELASLLTSELAKIVEFRFRNWVTDAFLPFADLYLQRYQQAQLEKREGAMTEEVALVRQVLRAAAVEPIEVIPGETLFDSSRHVGRSTANDPRFADGVITGVVRNGFIGEGRQVIRQPEVIVNRLR